MVIEICVGVITITFIVLSAYLVMTLRTATQTLRKAKQVLGKIDHELPQASKLLKNASDLTSDVKGKVDFLNSLFHPLTLMGKKSRGKHKHSRKGPNRVDKILGYVEEAIGAVKKFRKN